MMIALPLLLLPVYAWAAPNIIYVVVDDLDQMLMQTTSATPLPKTKRLLVDEGATFTNAFAHVPICNPSRAATLTGKYFHNLKATDNTHTHARRHGQGSRPHLRGGLPARWLRHGPLRQVRQRHAGGRHRAAGL